MPKKKIKIEKEHRIAWLNLASAYIYAGETISKKINIISSLPNEKWRNIVMVIPLLYLLRHALELSIKSLFISYNVEFENEHNLEKLFKKAEKLVDIKHQSTDKINKWVEIKCIVKEFSKTTYGGKRLFKKDDLNSSTLRYLQTDVINGYSELKNIDHDKLIKRVIRARRLCEILTLETNTGSVMHPL